MLRLAYAIVFISYFTSLTGQNVGIGNPSPNEKLDVAGNINLTGNLMVNGSPGQDGQFLSMKGGAMQWVNKDRFQKVILFTSSGTFTVPENTNEILVEIWGAGGGGHNPGGGGGSGGYMLCPFPISSGTSVTVTIGTGGSGGGPNLNATSGTSTQVALPGVLLTASGGGFADSTKTATLQRYIGGGGGLTGATPTSFKNFYAVNGNSGSPSFESYMAVSPTLYRVVSYLGIGGIAPFSGFDPDPVSTKYIDENGVSHFSNWNFNNSKFGNGGSVHPSSTNGLAGGNGRVIIYY